MMDDKFKELGRELMVAYYSGYFKVSIEEARECITKYSDYDASIQEKIETEKNLGTLDSWVNLKEFIAQKTKNNDEVSKLLLTALSNWLSANDLVIMPKKLISKNALRGAFQENIHLENDESELHTVEVTVSWATIKRIYKRIVELEAVDAAQQTTNN